MCGPMTGELKTACDDLKLNLDRYWAGQLNDNEVAAVERHLLDCDHCFGLWEIMRIIEDTPALVLETAAEPRPRKCRRIEAGHAERSHEQRRRP